MLCQVLKFILKLSENQRNEAKTKAFFFLSLQNLFCGPVRAQNLKNLMMPEKEIDSFQVQEKKIIEYSPVKYSNLKSEYEHNSVFLSFLRNMSERLMPELHAEC